MLQAGAHVGKIRSVANRHRCCHFVQSVPGIAVVSPRVATTPRRVIATLEDRKPCARQPRSAFGARSVVPAALSVVLAGIVVVVAAGMELLVSMLELGEVLGVGVGIGAELLEAGVCVLSVAVCA